MGQSESVENLTTREAPFRDELLNETLVTTLTEAKALITAWKEDYS